MSALASALSLVLAAIIVLVRELSSGMLCVTMPVRPVPTSAIVAKVTTVRMNIVSSTVLTPSTLRAFVVKVSSTIVMPHKRGTVVSVAAQPAQGVRQTQAPGPFLRGPRGVRCRRRQGGNLICLLRRRCWTM